MSRQLTALFIRLFSIWLALMGLQIYFIFYASKALLQIPFYLSLLCIALPVLLAVVLWKFPLAIAEKLLNGIHSSEEKTSISSRDIAAIASVVIGLWTVINALPNAVGGFVTVIGLFRQGMFDTSYAMSKLAILLQFGIGTFLIFRPWSLANRIFPTHSSAEQ